MDQKITRYQLIQIIDSKIKSLESEREKNGVNLWVLWGALAGIGWLFLDILEKGIFEYWSSIILFFVFISCYEILEGFKYLNVSSKPGDGAKTRFFIPEPETRFNVFLISLKSAILLLFVLFCEEISWKYWAIYLFCSVEILNFLLVFYMSIKKYPVTTSKIYSVGSDFSLKIRLLFLCLVLYQLLNIHLNFSPNNARLGFLFLGIYLLLLHLSNMPKEYRELDKLKKIQSDLIFEETSLAVSKERYLEFQRGLSLPTVLKESALAFESKISSYQEELRKYEIEFKEASKRLLEKHPSKINHNDIEEFTNARKKRRKTFNVAMKELDSIILYLLNLINWIVPLSSKDVVPFLKKFLSEKRLKLKKLNTKMKKVFNRIDKEWERVIGHIQIGIKGLESKANRLQSKLNSLKIKSAELKRRL